jgi:hypothetical protein
LENSAGTGFSYYIFNRKIRLDYDFNYIDNIYPQPEQNRAVPMTDVDSDREDKLWMNSIGIYFRLKKNIGLGLNVGQWHREFDLYHWKANRNYLGLN